MLDYRDARSEAFLSGMAALCIVGGCPLRRRDELQDHLGKGGFGTWCILGETTATADYGTNEQELLKRYNPIADMSEEEKIHATARRVGMDTPLEYKPGR
jgi:hypothetical protein